MPSLRHAAVVLGLLSCGPAMAAESGWQWQERVLADHPLVGRIWSNRDHRFVGLASVLTAATGAKYLLLGEKHDNRDHHRLQALVTGAVYRSGRRPALAFEMIEADKQPALDAFLAGHPADAGDLGNSVGWNRSGWGPWARYQPIADAAVAAGVPIIAANLPRSKIRAVAHEGFSVLGADLVRRTGLDKPLPDHLEADLEAELTAAHCGQIPASAIPGVARVQRARDAVMADRMVSASHGRGAILITGAGHARTDRGVPYYLRKLDPGGSIISIGFREVMADALSRSDYEETRPFDFVWFTPRVDEEDPCDQFKGQLKKLNKQPD